MSDSENSTGNLNANSESLYSHANSEQGNSTTVTGGASTSGGHSRLAGVSVSALMTTALLTVSPDTSVQEAALLMYEKKISCLPVVENNKLVGLITEADFVGRVVARGQVGAAMVVDMMTSNPWFVTPQQSVLDVLTLMTRHRVAHMPVCQADSHLLVGIVTQTDVIRHQIASSVFMVGDISRASSSHSIRQIVRELPRLLAGLVSQGNSAYETGRVMSTITGAVTRRLIELAEMQLGPAPIPYVWLACGSQGRQEQTGQTDQDNCLLLSDDYVESAHGEYFERFANFVCDGLNESGFVYCPGDMMASRSRWRQPLNVWRSYFKEWIERPGNEAQMLASVMFDLRPIAGEFSLYEPLSEESLQLASSNSIFVAHMTTNCLAHPPPLGWFGRIKIHKEGDAIGKVDLKHDGIVPIVDIARLHALSGKIPAVNTVERLGIRSEGSVVSPSGANNLLEAYETINLLRLKHQAEQIEQGAQPDNYIDPFHLTTLEKDRLREAFKTIRDIQSAMSNRVAVVGR